MGNKEYIWHSPQQELPKPDPVLDWLPVQVWVYTSDREIKEAHFHANDKRFSQPEHNGATIHGVVAWTSFRPTNPDWKNIRNNKPEKSGYVPDYSKACWVLDENKGIRRSSYNFKNEAFLSNSESGCVFFMRNTFLWTCYKPEPPVQDIVADFPVSQVKVETPVSLVRNTESTPVITSVRF